MDREISVQELQKRKKNRIIRIATALAVLMLLFLLLPRWLEGKIPIENMPIGTVDKGPIEISIAATGKLVPLSEEIIVSPVGSRILEVYKNPGDTVHEGEPLLKLDLASVETEYRQKIDEKEMMKSKEIQAVITLENALAALRMDQQVKEMQMKQLWSDLQGEKYLDSIGTSTPDKVRRAELNYAEAKLNLEQLEQKIINEQKNMTAGIRAQQLELSMFDKTLEEKARQLKNAQILAPQTATLTFIQNQIGMQVSAGDQLAIVSDLSRYKVECEIADGHRDKLSPGNRAVIIAGKANLPGTIYSITPSITDGVITFIVVPEDSSNPNLRSGLKTDVYVLYGSRTEVMRIPVFTQLKYYGPGTYEIWVVNGSRAVKRKVKLGESGFDYIEVADGLSPGEKIIMSDMERYKNKTELRTK